VSAQWPVRVVLDVTQETGTISGRLAVDGAPASLFYGWLELIDALERVAGSAPDPSEAIDEGERTCEC
jgi:hypothetical protein